MQKLAWLAPLALSLGLLRFSVLGQTTLYVAVVDGVVAVDVVKRTRTTLVSGLNMPYGIAVNWRGTGFVSDTGNNAIKTFLPDGTVSTFASGLNYPSGLAIGRADVAMVADFGSGCYYRLQAGAQKTIACGYDGPVSIRLREFMKCTPQLIVTSRGGRMDVLGQALDGTWTNKQILASQLSYPYDGVSDRAGNVYCSEYGRFRVLEFTALADGTINTNPVVFATGLNPIGLVFDHTGSLFEVDYNGTINQFVRTNGTLNPQPIAVVTGLSQPTYAVFAAPARVHLERQGANAVVTWPDATYFLQSAPTLESSFTNIQGVTSPYTNPLTGSMRLFRALSRYSR